MVHRKKGNGEAFIRHRKTREEYFPIVKGWTLIAQVVIERWVRSWKYPCTSLTSQDLEKILETIVVFCSDKNDMNDIETIWTISISFWKRYRNDINDIEYWVFDIETISNIVVWAHFSRSKRILIFVVWAHFSIWNDIRYRLPWLLHLETPPYGRKNIILYDKQAENSIAVAFFTVSHT